MAGKQGNILYLECNSGISGDMAVAALLDLGADKEVLKNVLRSIPINGFRIKISRVKKAGLDVCDFHVILDEAHENHDHDMEYLFGKGQAHHDGDHHAKQGREQGHTHGGRPHCGADHYSQCEEKHTGEHVHGPAYEEEYRHEAHSHKEHDHGHPHHHEHRNLPEILHIIGHTDMTEGARRTAEHIFRILAKAEAKAHGVAETEVHFHEVGAVDSIVDIISVAVCLDDLGITECIVPMLCEGTGTIRCQHGVMSVPVPAVLNIVQDHYLKLSVTDIKGELVTPTGAAIAAAIKTADRLPKSFRILKTGMGGGKRAYERPSILRAMLIEDMGEGGSKAEPDKTDMVNETDSNVNSIENPDNKDVIYKLETNIDDCSGEILGYVMERLLEAGARDVHYMPIYMKKNRPAYQLNVICKKEQISKLENIIFAETTTIGIRRQRMERSVLPRRNMEISTAYGEAAVKECRLPRGGVRCYPEYDSVKELCRKSEKPYREVYDLIAGQWKERALKSDKKPEKRVLKIRKFWRNT